MNPLQITHNQFKKVGKYTLRYWSLGNGPCTLVLLHGLASCVEHWYKIIPSLSQKYRIVAIDLLGHGFTDKPLLDYSIDCHTQFIIDAFNALHLSDFVLLGHSFGGGLALKLVLEKKVAAKQLILLSNAGFSRAVHWSLRLLTLPLLGHLLTLPSISGIRRSLHQKVFDSSVISEQLVQHIYSIFNTTGFRHALLSTLRNTSNILGAKKALIDQTQHNLAQLDVPSLIIWGEQDSILPLGAQQHSFKLLPAHAQRIILKECGHLPYLEKPEEVTRAIHDFLGHC